MLLWSAPHLKVDPALGDNHEMSSGAVLQKWLLDDLYLGRCKSAAAMLIHHQVIQTHLYDPPNKMQKVPLRSSGICKPLPCFCNFGMDGDSIRI